ncbi:hypothetical protein DFJ73DRAFT_815824 [Zopfochytrium polystomum]|nr:hypothetical protein DFJ73DRAFT_815824 [Zopfochytrium polystomum]
MASSSSSWLRLFLASGTAEMIGGAPSLVAYVLTGSAAPLFPVPFVAGSPGTMAAQVASTALSTFGSIPYLAAYFTHPTGEPLHLASLMPLAVAAFIYHTVSAASLLSPGVKDAKVKPIGVMHGLFAVGFARFMLAHRML